MLLLAELRAEDSEARSKRISWYKPQILDPKEAKTQACYVLCDRTSVTGHIDFPGETSGAEIDSTADCAGRLSRLEHHTEGNAGHSEIVHEQGDSDCDSDGDDDDLQNHEGRLYNYVGKQDLLLSDSDMEGIIRRQVRRHLCKTDVIITVLFNDSDYETYTIDARHVTKLRKLLQVIIDSCAEDVDQRFWIVHQNIIGVAVPVYPHDESMTCISRWDTKAYNSWVQDTMKNLTGPRRLEVYVVVEKDLMAVKREHGRSS